MNAPLHLSHELALQEIARGRAYCKYIVTDDIECSMQAVASVEQPDRSCQTQCSYHGGLSENSGLEVRWAPGATKHPFTVRRTA